MVVFALFSMAPPCWAGSMVIDGRTVSCSRARQVVDDPDLDNLGMAVPDRGLLVMNLTMARRSSPQGKWFIFYHECGHLHGKLDEMDADAFAVEVAIREGWYDARLLNEVCHSWGPIDAKASRTHPAPRVRCEGLQTNIARIETKLGTQVAAVNPPSYPLTTPTGTSRPPPPLSRVEPQPVPRAPAQQAATSSSGFLISDEAPASR